jgi:hypothetical protein
MENLPIPLTGSLLLLIAPRSFLREALPPFIAHLAASELIRVLDGGNCFHGYAIARALRRQTAGVQAALERIQVARAFTCYQVLTLLSETSSGFVPTLGLELLGTFYDESVPLEERRRLLEQSLLHLQRLSQMAPVALSASSSADSQSDEWLPMLQEAAARVWRLEANSAPISLLLL